MSNTMARAIVLLLVTTAPGTAEIPPPDLWTEADIKPWSAGAMSRDRASIKSNAARLMGRHGVELIAQPGDRPVSFSLNLGKAWDLSDADQLVLAWRVLEGQATGGGNPQVTVWAKNEIGKGFSSYSDLPISGKWQHIRLDLTSPDAVEKQYGAASRQGVERVDITLPATDRAVRVLVDDLHFERSAAVIMKRARERAPLEEDIRPERYAKYLCGSHLKPAQRPALEALYAPQGPPPETPHQAWGKPLGAGPLRVLFVVNLAFQREVVELAQRFDMVYDFVPLLMVQRYKPDVLTDLARKEYDVIVTSALDADARMAPFIEWLTMQVAAGKGWIAINSSGRAGEIELPFTGVRGEKPVVDKWQVGRQHPIVAGAPIDLLPPFRTRQYAAAGNDAEVILRGASGDAKMIVKTHGDGRVVNLCSGFGNGAFSILPTPTGGEHVKHQFPYWEYEYSLLAKAMLWAAGRAPPVSVVPSGELRRRREAETTVAFNFSAKAPFKGSAAATWQLTDGSRREVAAQQLTVAGAMTIEVPVPRGMPVGTQALELSVLDDQGRVVDWWRWPWTVEGNVEIEPVDLDRPHYTHGDEIGVTATVRNAGAAVDGTVQFEIHDTWRRLIYRDVSELEIAAGTTTKPLSIEVSPAFLTDVATLKVSVLDGHGTTAVAFRRLYVPLDPKKKHETWWVGATAGGSNMHPHIYEHLAKHVRALGINTIMTNGRHQAEQAELIVDNNLWVTPENIINTGRWNRRFADGIRRPCLSDPVVRTRNRQVTSAFAGSFRRFGALGYSSMAEHSLCTARPNGTACLGPYCGAEFVAHLQRLYGGLKELNAQWDTEYESWDGVKALRWEDGAADLKNPARWIDFRLFMEDVYTGMQWRFNETIRRVHPEAYAGYNCGVYGESPFGGFNRAKLGRASNFSIEYQPSRLEDKGMSTTMELLLGSSPDIKVGYYTGYKYMDFEPDRYWFKAWWMACRQQYGPFFYTVNNDASTFADYAYVKIHPTLVDNGFSSYIDEPLKALVHGVGKLFLNVQRDVDIAVYHSQASMMRRSYETHRFRQKTRLPKWDVRKLLREIDQDYRRLVAAQLFAGEANHFKVLILADAVSLGAPEWQALETFMQQGGHVIGFARTGITDEHGTYHQDKHPESRVFGVKYTREAFKWRPEKLLQKRAVAEVLASNRVINVGADVRAVFADGGLAVGYKKHGAGGAIYCNFSSNMALVDLNHDFLAQLLRVAGVDSSPLVLRDDRRAGGFQVFRYSSGGIRFYALLQTMGSGHPAGTPLQLVTGGPSYVYNMLDESVTGTRDRIDFKAPGKGRPVLCAAMKYAVDEVKISGANAAKAGDSYPFSIRITGGGRMTGDHIVRFEVIDPNDTIVEVHTRNAKTSQGHYRGHVPFALNAPAGAWRLVARDIISGKSVTKKIEVRQ
ncbi:MAG: beta-galactosidase trimerization domain-containing protein [Lentisphaeria bacterium]|nr:beta-galactosidase trimerization domain-containing protein [Lentisphaeria bacterium]MDP7740449.1 beta-galactosidase trimerization domain-containing protein [Lentisphaeria bacterium]